MRHTTMRPADPRLYYFRECRVCDHDAGEACDRCADVRRAWEAHRERIARANPAWREMQVRDAADAAMRADLVA